MELPAKSGLKSKWLEKTVTNANPLIPTVRYTMATFVTRLHPENWMMHKKKAGKPKPKKYIA